MRMFYLSLDISPSKSHNSYIRHRSKGPRSHVVKKKKDTHTHTYNLANSRESLQAQENVAKFSKQKGQQFV